MTMQEYLLHAIKTHLLVMQGPTKELCQFNLKMIDILIDSDASRKQAESVQLLKMLVDNMLQSIVETIDRIEESEVEKGKILSPAMNTTRHKIASTLTAYAEAVSDNEIKGAYNAVVDEIAKAFKMFHFCGLIHKIDIKDIRGNSIC